MRVPANTPEFICRLLDGGAMGVIAPHVRSAEEAREVVRYAKFTPQGERGAGGALPHYHYRSFPSAVVNQAMNDATMVVVMMETVAALEHVEEIAAVDGVDMMLIGTNDLCNEMGITGQFDHANVRDAYLRTIAACRKHGKHVGVGGLASRPDLMAEYVRQGARYVSTGTDLSFLLAAVSGEGEVRAGHLSHRAGRPPAMRGGEADAAISVSAGLANDNRSYVRIAAKSATHASMIASIEPNTRAPACVRRCVFEASVPASPSTSAPAWPIDTPSFASRPAISA